MSSSQRDLTDKGPGRVVFCGPSVFARALHPMSPVESMTEICRDRSRKVKRWHGVKMVLLWSGQAHPKRE